MYPLAYYPHNLHFIWMGATASGRKDLALESARKLAAAIPHEALSTVPILQGFLVVPYWAKVRFGRWDEILADSEKGSAAMSMYSRGLAHLGNDGKTELWGWDFAVQGSPPAPPFIDVRCEE